MMRTFESVQIFPFIWEMLLKYIEIGLSSSMRLTRRNSKQRESENLAWLHKSLLLCINIKYWISSTVFFCKGTQQCSCTLLQARAILPTQGAIPQNKYSEQRRLYRTSHPPKKKERKWTDRYMQMVKQYTGRARLIRSHSSARFCLELSGNSN